MTSNRLDREIGLTSGVRGATHSTEFISNGLLNATEGVDFTDIA